jgi:hypothetical protein
MSMLRTRWAAIGAAVAVTLGAGGLSIVGATASTGERTAYIPITPCRLADTRPAPANRGPRVAPIGPAETYTLNAHGTNGDCTIPAGATALSLNVTALGATDATFLTLFPTGAEQPTTSNLNPTPGQPPVPNAVVVDISAGGQFNVFNQFGSVDVIIDVAGYYEDHNHDDRYVMLPTDQIVVNPYNFRVVTGTGWTVTLLPSHTATAASECILAPFEPPVGRRLVDAQFSYISAAGANPVNMTVIGLRGTPGSSTGILLPLPLPVVNAPATGVGLIGTRTALFPADTIVPADYSYSIALCTDDAFSLTGLSIGLG